MKQLPRLVYFIPFYGTYRLVKRLRKVERIVDKHNIIAEEIRADLDYMRHTSFREMQFYEARIETIYQRIMQLLIMDPTDAKISSTKLKSVDLKNTAILRRDSRLKNIVDRYASKISNKQVKQ